MTSCCGHVCLLFDVFLEQMSLYEEEGILRVGMGPSIQVRTNCFFLTPFYLCYRTLALKISLLFLLLNYKTKFASLGGMFRRRVQFLFFS